LVALRPQDDISINMAHPRATSPYLDSDRPAHSWTVRIETDTDFGRGFWRLQRQAAPLKTEKTKQEDQAALLFLPDISTLEKTRLVHFEETGLCGIPIEISSFPFPGIGDCKCRKNARVTFAMRDFDGLKCIQAVVDGDLKPLRAAERLGPTTVARASKFLPGSIQNNYNRPLKRASHALLLP
jgi:hypothetical protein